MKNVYLSLAFLVAYINLQAATITSNGTGGGTWSSTSTWSGGVVPATSDDVVIATSDVVTQTTVVTVLSLTIGQSAKLLAQADFNITGTGVSLGFAGTAASPGLLEISGTTPITFTVAGTANQGSVAGIIGKITVKNAAHILTIKRGINFGISGGFDMQSGTIKLSGPYSLSSDPSTVNKITNLEIGDGIVSTQIYSYLTAPLSFYNNGTITVKNNASLYCQGYTTLNAPNPTSGANVSLNILNGGSVYNGTNTTGTTANVFQYIPLMNSGLSDASAVTGSLYLYMIGSSAVSFNIPAGSIGNLFFGTTSATSSPTINVFTNGLVHEPFAFLAISRALVNLAAQHLLAL